jgi:hypothetical protein
MEIVAENNGAQNYPYPLEVLPEDRTEWPDGAGNAHRQLLRELDRWCREHDCSMVTNSWVAEEAVRRGW